MKKEKFLYSESDLDNVYLDVIIQYECQGCDRNHVKIPAVKELHFLIILNLVFKKGELTSAEVAYLERMVRDKCWHMVDRPFEGIYSSGPMVFKWTGKAWQYA
jgi:hypothetical protein